MKPGKEHGARGSTPAETRTFFDRPAGGIVVFADGIKLLANAFEFSLLMSFITGRFFRPSVEEFSALALAPNGEFSLLFFPFFVRVFEQSANVIIQIVA